jgi:hypothetical protein
MLIYGVVIDGTMITNLLQTDCRGGALFNRACCSPSCAGGPAGLGLLRLPCRLAAWPAQALRNCGMALAALRVARLVLAASSRCPPRCATTSSCAT